MIARHNELFLSGLLFLQNVHRRRLLLLNRLCQAVEQVHQVSFVLLLSAVPGAALVVSAPGAKPHLTSRDLPQL